MLSSKWLLCNKKSPDYFRAFFIFAILMTQNENINSYHLFQQLKLSELYGKKHRPIVIADNLRTPENMGSVLRLAANVGAEKVLFLKGDIGETPRSWKIKKTASGAEEKVSWKIIAQDELHENIPPDYLLVAIETAESAVNIYQTALPPKVAFIVGHEVFGISDTLLQRADKIVYIPIPGVISSLNVTHALGIAAFEWLRQQFWSDREATK